MRLRAKTDANQERIVCALRKAGCRVLSLAALGSGAPDLLARSPRGTLFLLECKDGSKPPSKRRLTPDQIAFHAHWYGNVYVVLNEEDALRAVGLLSDRR